MRRFYFNFLIFAFLLLFGSENANSELPASIPLNSFVKGADISWLPQMEATGYKFYKDQGVE